MVNAPMALQAGRPGLRQPMSSRKGAWRGAVAKHPTWAGRRPRGAEPRGCVRASGRGRGLGDPSGLGRGEARAQRLIVPPRGRLSSRPAEEPCTARNCARARSACGAGTAGRTGPSGVVWGLTAPSSSEPAAGRSEPRGRCIRAHSSGCKAERLLCSRGCSTALGRRRRRLKIRPGARREDEESLTSSSCPDPWA